MDKTYIEIDMTNIFDFYKIIQKGALDVIERFNLKTINGYNTWDCFKKKNSNRYFRKHLGFTYHSIIINNHKYKRFFRIYDKHKYMLFALKHGFVLPIFTN
jgi:hypothetical protein